MSFAATISKLFSYFLKTLGVAVLLFAVYRTYSYSGILYSMVKTKDVSMLSQLIFPIGEVVVILLFARLLFWLSKK